VTTEPLDFQEHLEYLDSQDWKEVLESQAIQVAMGQRDNPADLGREALMDPWDPLDLRETLDFGVTREIQQSVDREEEETPESAAIQDIREAPVFQDFLGRRVGRDPLDHLMLLVQLVHRVLRVSWVSGSRAPKDPRVIRVFQDPLGLRDPLVLWEDLRSWWRKGQRATEGTRA